MKHLLLILLFVPFISIGQIKTLDELKRITSKETFERVCIENGYEKFRPNNEMYISYLLNPKYDDENELPIGWDGYANYSVSGKGFIFGFMDNELNFNRDYNSIWVEAESNCNYLDIAEFKDIDYLYMEYVVLMKYDCLPNGKLGFGKSKDRSIIMFSKKHPN